SPHRRDEHRLSRRSLHRARHGRALSRCALRRDRPAAGAAVHERPRAEEGRRGARAHERPPDRRHDHEADRPLRVSRRASGRKRREQVLVSRKDPRRRHGRVRAEVARHRPSGSRRLSRHQLSGVRRMIRQKVRPMVLFALVLAAAPVGATTGREVIDEAQKKNGFSTWKDRTLEATMTTYSGGSLTRSRDMIVSEQTDPRGEHRTFMNFTGPADVQGTRFLHLSPRGAADQQWLYTPTVRRVRRLGEAQREENFFGADLSYRDLELLVRIQQWNDAESTATLAEKDETVDGHACHVVALVPKNEEFPHYSKYALWFAKDDA